MLGEFILSDDENSSNSDNEFSDVSIGKIAIRYIDNRENLVESYDKLSEIRFKDLNSNNLKIEYNNTTNNISKINNILVKRSSKNLNNLNSKDKGNESYICHSSMNDSDISIQKIKDSYDLQFTKIDLTEPMYKNNTNNNDPDKIICKYLSLFSRYIE